MKLFVFYLAGGPERKFQRMIRNVIDAPRLRPKQPVAERYFSRLFGVRIKFVSYAWGQMHFELSEEEATVFLLKWS